MQNTPNLSCVEMDDITGLHLSIVSSENIPKGSYSVEVLFWPMSDFLGFIWWLHYSTGTYEEELSSTSRVLLPFEFNPDDDIILSVLEY